MVGALALTAVVATRRSAIDNRIIELFFNIYAPVVCGVLIKWVSVNPKNLFYGQTYYNRKRSEMQFFDVTSQLA